jgi:hypothetical protein
MVRDAKDVEPSASVQVDQFRERQVAVAPRRVRVQLTKEHAVTHRF